MPGPRELAYHLECANCGLQGCKHVDDKCLFEPTDFKPIGPERLSVEEIQALRSRIKSSAHESKLRRELRQRCRHTVAGSVGNGFESCFACGEPRARPLAPADEAP